MYAPVPSGGGADAPRRAGLATSQLLGLAPCRYVLRLEPIASQDPDQLIAGSPEPSSDASLAALTAVAPDLR